MQIKKTLGSLVVCVALASPLAACGKSNDGGNGPAMFTDNNGLLTVPATSPLRSHLTVQPVGRGGAAQMVSVPAMVEADPARVANILTPLAGRVAALKVELGDRVTKGQVLAVIASGDMAQAYSDDAKARDAYALAKQQLDRARGVHQAGGAADKDLEAAQSNFNQAEAEMNRARERLNSLSDASAGSAHQLVLTAPRSGVVTTLSIADGAQVSDPTATLMTVTNLERVFVTANIAENDIGKIGLGTNADIALTAFPNQALHGKVTEANAVIEPDTRRQKVRIALPNIGGRLMPNMYGTVTLAVPAAQSVFVPQSALLMNNDSISVLVEVRPWVFQRRAVRIGDETDTEARVLSGLKPGDRIVAKGGVLLND